MAAPMTAPTEVEEPTIEVGDRLEKSRRHCGIKSAKAMAELLNERLGDRVSISASTVNAWEAGTNQPTRGVRMDELVHVWVDICNEVGAPLGKATSVEFVYGLRSGSFPSGLFALPEPSGDQGALLDDDGYPLDFWSRPFLTPV